jgi:hypothetical protein
MFTLSDCFTPRSERFLGVREFEGGWRIKLYSIISGDQPFDGAAMESALDLAARAAGVHRARAEPAGGGRGRPIWTAICEAQDPHVGIRAMRALVERAA